MADKDHLILTAIGPDRVGLVQNISEFISRYGCNIEDSKMAVFCGEFAVIVLISGTATDLDRIGLNYREIESETGLSLAIKTPASRKATEFFLPYVSARRCAAWASI
jgi:glycine cleavage system transcriptional repressor